MARMLVTPYPERFRGKARRFVLAAMGLLSFACHGSGIRIHDVQIAEVTGVEIERASSAPEYGEQCRDWALDAEAAAAFFAMSARITPREYHHDFDTAPCRVSGVVRYDGMDWRFQINGAAKGTWTRGAEIIYFGCAQDACARLVMWEPPVDVVAQNYAETYRVPVAEVARRMALGREAGCLQQRLRSELPETFAGLYIEHEPEFRIVVQFTEDPQMHLAAYTHDLEFVAKLAPRSLESLSAVQEELAELLKGAGMEFESGIDIEKSEINVYVLDPAAASRYLSGLLSKRGFISIHRTTGFPEPFAVSGGNQLMGPAPLCWSGSTSPACGSQHPESGAKSVRVTQIADAVFRTGASDRSSEAEACRSWRLTSAEAEEFFALSEEISQQEAMSHFYWLPCSISGRIEKDGVEWEFTINGAATAVLKRNDEWRYFGCGVAACEKLVMLPTDYMNPDP